MSKLNRVLMVAAVLIAVIASSPGQSRAVDLTHSFVVGGDIGFNLDPDLLWIEKRIRELSQKLGRPVDYLE